MRLSTFDETGHLEDPSKRDLYEDQVPPHAPGDDRQSAELDPEPEPAPALVPKPKRAPRAKAVVEAPSSSG